MGAGEVDYSGSQVEVGFWWEGVGSGISVVLERLSGKGWLYGRREGVGVGVGRKVAYRLSDKRVEGHCVYTRRM